MTCSVVLEKDGTSNNYSASGGASTFSGLMELVTSFAANYLMVMSDAIKQLREIALREGMPSSISEHDLSHAVNILAAAKAKIIQSGGVGSHMDVVDGVTCEEIERGFARLMERLKERGG